MIDYLLTSLQSGLFKEETTEERVRELKERFMSAYDVTADGRLQIQEVQLLLQTPGFGPELF